MKEDPALKRDPALTRTGPLPAAVLTVPEYRDVSVKPSPIQHAAWQKCQSRLVHTAVRWWWVRGWWVPWWGTAGWGTWWVGTVPGTPYQWWCTVGTVPGPVPVPGPVLVLHLALSLYLALSLSLSLYLTVSLPCPCTPPCLYRVLNARPVSSMPGTRPALCRAVPALGRALQSRVLHGLGI